MLGIQKEIYNVFKYSSSSYFFASLLFPPKKRKAIFNLYAFLRTFDEFIDQPVQEKTQYFELKKEYLSGKSGKLVITNFFELERKYRFNKAWINAFFNAMESDLVKKRYETLKELEIYINGVAEIVGLFIYKIMELPPEAEKYAMLQGKAMHYMNFIRDIGEDKNLLGREYVPVQHQKMFGLDSLDETYVYKHREEFIKLVRYEISCYRKLQKEAEKGYKCFPKRLLVPIKIAAESCKWVMDKIETDPIQVYKGRIKPPKNVLLRILIKYLYFFLNSSWKQIVLH